MYCALTGSNIYIWLWIRSKILCIIIIKPGFILLMPIVLTYIVSLSNIIYQVYGFWLVYLLQVGLIVCLSKTSPPYSFYTWRWFHLEVPLSGFLLVVQIKNFKWPCTGSCDQVNYQHIHCKTGISNAILDI